MKYQCFMSKKERMGFLHKAKIKANKNEKMVEMINPPKKPSQVFLGEMRGFILVLPKKTPTKYAPISVKNVAIQT